MPETLVSSIVGDPFCGFCNRVRLSAEGKLLLCLLRDDEADLRSVIRSGGGVSAIREALSSILQKPVGMPSIRGFTPAVACTKSAARRSF